MNKSEILELVLLKQEGSYWDFKREWYSPDKKADLLHDIICMANNLWWTVMLHFHIENSILYRLTGHLERNFKIWTNSKKRIILRDVLEKWTCPM